MHNKLLGLTPALGWNSWNTFTWDINEKLIRDIADSFISEGYKDAGYEYIVIDDCWSLKQRDEEGNLIVDINVKIFLNNCANIFMYNCSVVFIYYFR
ncbi:MAG: hypothetical protein E6176_12405, partial [Clostridium celatum]|nr:hypothetical protein [Clostridium celatum]